MALRILQISPYYLPDVQFGGPVYSVSSLCEGLVAAGHQVKVYTVCYGKAKPHVATINGVEVHYFRGSGGRPSQISFGLWRFLQKHAKEFDLVHLHTWWNILIFRSLLILKSKQVPAVLSPRGMMSDYSFTHRKSVLKNYFQQTTGRQLLQGVGLQATSEAEAQEMANRCGRKLTEVNIIPNLVSLTQGNAYEAPPDGFVIGLLSRLHHKKGIDLLLQAVALVPEVTELVFGGTGDPAYEQWMRDEINRLGIAHKVRFAGWINDSEKPAFLRQIHVFILPSYNENFANVVAEAWSMGKPTIISNGVGLHEFLAKYDAGWLCTPDVPSVAAAIQQAWEDRARWQEKGEAALTLVRDQLNGNQLIQAYCQMYSDVIAPSKDKELVEEKYILGLNAFHADASAALFYKGELVAAAEEERFTRIKHWAGFPAQAVQFCLNEAGIGINEVSQIAIGRDPKAKWDRKAKFLANNPKAISFVLKGRLSNASGAKSVVDELAQQFLVPRDSIQSKINYIEHHRSHLASSFFASPYESAAIISIDGSGDFTTTMMAVGRGNKIEVLQSIDFPHSLGIFYTTFTQFLGFPHYGDEYKVMGLAPYGTPRFASDLQALILLQNDGTFRLDLDWFRNGADGFVYYDDNQQPFIPELYTSRLVAKFGPPRQKDEPITQFHKDMAASVQHTVEQVIFHMLRHLYAQTGLKQLCIAGGVAQNSVANGKITLHTPFESVYLPPAGHDAGLAMGAALWMHHQVYAANRSQPMYTAATGSSFTNEQILSILGEKKLHITYYTDFDILCDKVAAAIADGAVVGWFRGRAEFGPRALGHRSILADPRRADAKALINEKIKRRESFRPFAPAILEDYTADYFSQGEPAPFMEKVYPIRKEKQSEIPAVTHVDGTGRLQTVSPTYHRDFYTLINAFRKITGVPILLNTSFNENEPIVNTPEHALDCFLRTKMDLLVVEDIVISRELVNE